MLAALLTLALIAVPATRYQGWMRPIHIAGPSMAESLHGEHVVLRCPRCTFAWKRALGLVGDDVVTCPACGGEYAPTPEQREDVKPGQRVWIDRWARPRRWDPVALDLPGKLARSEGQALAVKRVVGLPGEHVAIAAGDIWINGVRQEKSLNEFLRVAILVHDSRLADPLGQPRWRPAKHANGSDTAWVVAPDGWRLRGGIETDSTTAWIEYHGVPLFRPSSIDAAPWPWVDFYPTNGELSRQLHRVTDMLVQQELEVVGPVTCTCALAVHRGALRLVWRSAPAEVRGTWNDEPLRLTPSDDPPASRPTRGLDTLWWGLLDGRAVLSIHGKTWSAQLPDGGAQQPIAVPDAPLAFAAEGGTVVVRRNQVWRDLHYLPPIPGKPWSLQLGQDQYAVLGDNQPLSDDSRLWGAVEAKTIRGKVLRR